ncbi:MAG: hypothetical protein J6B89_03500 [Bacilli bacterium]|nr:hypothetical protein [Bacilli bacterium]
MEDKLNNISYEYHKLEQLKHLMETIENSYFLEVNVSSKEAKNMLAYNYKRNQALFSLGFDVLINSLKVMKTNIDSLYNDLKEMKGEN